MKTSIKTIMISGTLAIVTTASAYAADNIENWRKIEGVKQESEKGVINNMLSFPDQPNEIWNWRKVKEAGQQKSVYQPHVHTGKRNNNTK